MKDSYSRLKETAFGIRMPILWLPSYLQSFFVKPNENAAGNARHVSCFESFEAELPQWIEKLKNLNISTEAEFLSVGKMLQLHYQQARDISATCTSIVDLMRGEDVKKAMEGLETLNRGVILLEHESRRGLEILHRIREKLEGAETLIKGFENIARSLNMLCVSTRIEDARFSQIDTGFGSLSDDIRKLTVSIEAKSSSTQEESRSLKLSISHALQRISQIQSKQHSHSELILSRTESNLAAIRGKYEHSTALAEGISAKYQDLLRSIGEIVASMQFHDITRQRFEHIQKALGTLIPSLRASESETVEDVCKLQILQLEQSRDAFIQAVQNIFENLKNTAQAIREISRETLQISGTADQVGGSFLSTVESELSTVASVLCEYSKINQELSLATRSAVDKTVGMSAFVRDIEKIGFEVKLIALNAVVKAAHIGEEGKALSTLAEAIHHFSSDAGILTDEVSRGFTSIASTAQELSKGLTIEQDGQTNGNSLLAEEMKSLITLLNGINAETVSLMKLMEKSETSLIESIEETICKISVDKEVTTVIDEIISGLKTLEDFAGAHITERSRRSSNKLLESLESTYTMDSERLAHEHLSKLSGLDSASARVFDDALAIADTANDKSNKGDEEDLGDNVELF